jgi:hypothetical protein
LTTGGPAQFTEPEVTAGLVNPATATVGFPATATVGFPGNYPYAQTPAAPPKGDTFVSGMAGLAGLGADTRAEMTLSKVLDGSYGRDLVALRRTQQIRNGDLVTMGMKTTDSAKRAQIAAAAAANRDALKATMAAIDRYNVVVGHVRTYSFGQIKPSVLSGMGSLGLEPVTTATLIIVGGVVLSVALQALANLVLAAYGKESTAKGLFEQIGGAVDSTSKLVANITIAAIVGVGIYFGAKLLRSYRSSQTYSLAKVE